MAERARGNLKRAGVMNGEVQVSGAESIPYRDGSFDVVISNGVINLSPAKDEVFTWSTSGHRVSPTSRFTVDALFGARKAG